MSEDQEFDYLYNNTLRFLTIRPRSEKEVFDYLVKKLKTQNSKGKIEIQNRENVDDRLIKKIIERLKDYKFIDDLEFARWFLENRKKSIRIVRFELGQKGISKEIIEKALQDFDLEKKENSLLDKLIQKKWETVSRSPREKQYEKMMRFILSKGFDYDEVKKKISPLFPRRSDQ